MPQQLGPGDARCGRPRRHADRGPRRILEADAARRRSGEEFDADLRLSRTAGDIPFSLCHKPSDLLSVGDAHSQAVAIAKDLLHLHDIKIVHGLDVKLAEELRSLLGLPDVAVNLVTDWCRQAPGRALWIVGEAMFKVQTILHPAERALTWTNTSLEKAA